MSTKLLGGLSICLNCNKEGYIGAYEISYTCYICKKDALNKDACSSGFSIVHLCTNHYFSCIICCLCGDIHKKTHEGKISCPCGIIIEENMRNYLCGCIGKCDLRYCSIKCKEHTEKKKQCNIQCCISTLGKHCYKTSDRPW